MRTLTPFRHQLASAVDCARMTLDNCGFRFVRVQIRHRQWFDPHGPGFGSPLDAITDLTPTPRVREFGVNYRPGQGGTFEAGDLMVDQLSATYTRAQLVGGDSPTDEWHWLIDGQAYTVHRVTERLKGWEVHLRRRRS